MILIAENDPLHRAFARRVVDDLWNGETEIIEAEDTPEAVVIAQSHPIAHAVLDLRLPNGSGVEVARALWAVSSKVKVIFWSNFADEAYVRSLARIVPAGAGYGYVLKSAPEQEMRAALESVFRKDRRVIDRGIREVQNRVSNRFAGLSDVEYDALVDIALGMTDRAIAVRRRLSVRGVQNRLRHLYEKLEISLHADAASGDTQFNARARAITIALQRGLLNFDLLHREEGRLREWIAQSARAPQPRKPI